MDSIKFVSRMANWSMKNRWRVPNTECPLGIDGIGGICSWRSIEIPASFPLFWCRVGEIFDAKVFIVYVTHDLCVSLHQLSPNQYHSIGKHRWRTHWPLWGGWDMFLSWWVGRFCFTVVFGVSFFFWWLPLSCWKSFTSSSFFFTFLFTRNRVEVPVVDVFEEYQKMMVLRRRSHPCYTIVDAPVFPISDPKE